MYARAIKPSDYAGENPQPDAVAGRPLSVLVLSPDPSVPGGVSVFAEMMKAHFTRCRATSFHVGSVGGRKETVFSVTKRLLAAPVAILRLVKRQHFDVVHINPSLDVKSIVRDGLILLALRVAGFKRTMVYFHGWQGELAARIQRGRSLRKAFAWVLNGTGHIMVLSLAFKTALQDMGVDGSRISSARTMFDGDGLKAASEVQPQGRRTILYLSRFVREKGVHELLEAFARLAVQYPDVDLIMAGEGPEGAALRARTAALGLEGRVTFPGYVRGGQKYRLLKSCTVFALPTYLSGEGMPVALLEAMGAGKPLLTGKAGGIADIIAEPENGILLHTINTDTVEAALHRFLEDKEYCRQAGACNLAYAWECFEAGIVTAEIEAAYERIAGR